MTDRAGAGQAPARATIEPEGLPTGRERPITIRWTPAHRGALCGGRGRVALRPGGPGLPARGKPGPPHTKNDHGPNPTHRGVDSEAAGGNDL